ncbi:hypothetical protein IG514_17825, partial [Vibrio cholerae]|nr:hypothetical protein [Vibrio cholerae]
NFINQTSQIAKNFVQSSNLLIIASHSNKVIREICNKAIVFERGKVVDFTNVNDALKTYNQKSVLNKINSDYLSSRKTKNGKSTLKNYLLVNDTSMSENLGCQAVKRSIDMLFSKRASCIMAVPLGYGSEYFNSIASKSSEWIDKTDGFPKYKDYTSEVDYDSWCAIAKQFRENDKYFNDIENYDFIVVNAEGSIHHNSKRALALLAQIKYLSEVKPLFVLNASVFNIDSRILTDAFKNVQIVHSREGFTYSYLNSLKIASIYSPDLASLYIADLICYPNLYVKKEKRLCLISTGVLNGSDYIASIVNLIRCKGLEAVYLSMSDGNEDSVSIEICNTLGVKHFRANDIPLEHTLNFLTQFDYVVSGRHHLNLFVLATESKLICLPSNTLKVEGTLGFISKNRPMAYSLEQLSSLIDNYSFEVPEKVIKSFSKNIKL